MLLARRLNKQLFLTQSLRLEFEADYAELFPTFPKSLWQFTNIFIASYFFLSFFLDTDQGTNKLPGTKHPAVNAWNSANYKAIGCYRILL